MKIVAISDTHMEESRVIIPKCDLLIHTGDCDIRTLDHLKQLNSWFYNQPAKYKIFVAGNHDFYLERLNYHMVCDILHNCYYLFNNSIEIEGLKIWGSPYSPKFNNWAFMLDEEGLSKIYSKIPEETDIVLSHAPPYGILDETDFCQTHAGSVSLLKKIKEIQPKLHIFGHIHEGYGKYTDYKTDYINASQMTSTYKLENKPIELTIDV